MTIRAKQETIRLRADLELVRFSCANCSGSFISREVDNCPLCTSKKEVERLRGQLDIAKRTLERLQGKNRELQGRVDILDAMKYAAEIADEEEIREIGKFVGKIFNDDSYSMLAVMYRKGSDMPVGFKLSTVESSEEYRCRTVGGVSLAGSYDNAMRSYGARSAQRALARAIGSRLDNSSEFEYEP